MPYFVIYRIRAEWIPVVGQQQQQLLFREERAPDLHENSNLAPLNVWHSERERRRDFIPAPMWPSAAVAARGEIKLKGEIAIRGVLYAK